MAELPQDRHVVPGDPALGDLAVAIRNTVPKSNCVLAPEAGSGPIDPR
jgi:hypothetical protein